MEQRENKRKGRKFLVVIIIALLAAGIYAEVSNNLVSDAFRMSERRLMPDGIRFEYSSGQEPVFSGGKEGFLCVTKDGADYYSFKGEMLWRVTFTMQSPHIIKNGDSWAILEPMGRTVYVCGPEGLIYSVSAEFPILNASLNSIQCLALILEAGGYYEIRIFNSQGQSAFTRKSELEGVYPVCAAVSNNGYYYCVSYLDTTKTALSSRLLYLYTDSGAKNFGTDTQTPFTAIEKQNSVITNIFFGANDNLTGISDNEIFITTSKGKEEFKLELQRQLQAYSFGEKIFGFVSGRQLSGAVENPQEGSAQWYDYNGKLIGAADDLEAKLIDIYDNNILLKTKDSYILTNEKGRRIWTYDTSEDIIAIIPNGAKSAVIAKKGFAEVYTLKKPKGSGENS